MRLGEFVPGIVEDAQPLIWGLETYDSFVDMEETGCTYSVELAPMEVVAGRMFFGGAARKSLRRKRLTTILLAGYP
jgi:hypothetical protein